MNNIFENDSLIDISEEPITLGEAFYKSLFKNNRNSMLLINIKTLAIEDCNLSACSFYGYSYEEMLRLKISDINTYSEDETAKEMQLAKNEQREEFYFKHRLANGRICDVSVNSTPITLNNKEYLFSIVIDASKSMLYKEKINQYYSELEKQVTERTHEITKLNKILEKGIEESEERFRATFEQAAVGICHTSLDGRFLIVNKRCCDIIGYTNEELLQMKFEDISFIDDLQASLDIKRNLLDGRIDKHSLEKRYIRKDGSIVWLQLTISLMYDINAQPIRVITVVQDITYNKMMEHAFTESQTYINSLVESTSDYIWTVEAEQFRLKTYNAAFNNYYKSICGTTSNLTIGASMFLELDCDEEVKFYKRAVLEGPYKLEYETKDRSKNFLVMVSPLINNGKVFGVSVIAKDITETIQNQRLIKKQQEQEKIHQIEMERTKNEALVESIKLKDDFFYLITHELKTPMAVINLALQAIDYSCKGEVTKKLENYLNTIKLNVSRQIRLVNNLLDIIRINSGHLKMYESNFNIVKVIETITNSVQLYAVQKNVKLKFNTKLSERYIYSDEQKIERILLNLLSNALKFTPSGKSITVTLSTKKYSNKNMISVRVKDEGVGIPQDKQEIIFERFGQVDNSLSRQAEGTGLGLHLVKLLINSLGGEISLESVVGTGSTFTFLLPAIKAFDDSQVVACNNISNPFVDSDSRILQSAAIEFSDIYF